VKLSLNQQILAKKCHKKVNKGKKEKEKEARRDARRRTFLTYSHTDSEEILAHNSGLESGMLGGVVSNSHMHQGSGDNRWKECAIYEMIRGKLYFTAHSDDSQTMKAIRDFPQRFYFSNYLPGMLAARRSWNT
jgi:hypothetical protein